MSVVILQMRPTLSSQNPMDLRLLDIKHLSDLVLRHCLGQCANFTNLIVSQFRSPVPRTFCRNHKAVGVGVVHVFGARDPFKVVRAIIRLVAVNVIDLMLTGRRWTNKGFSNKAVNKALLLLSGKADGRAEIATSRGLQSEYVLAEIHSHLAAIAACPPDYSAPDRSDTALSRDFMAPLKSHNRFPDFNHIHPHAVSNSLACNFFTALKQGEF